MSIQQPLPEFIKVNNEVQFSAAFDIDSEGHFVNDWLILTNEELIVLDNNGKKKTQLFLEQIKAATIENVVGGGYLLIETEEGYSQIICRFTSSKMKLFSVACEMIESFRKEGILQGSTSNLPASCTSCGRPLPEWTNVCRRCVDKRKVIFRILDYTKPYRGRMIAASLMMITATLITLIPPYLTKVIVDEVLEPKATGMLLLVLVLALTATQLLQEALAIVRGYLGVWVGSHIMNDLRKDTYKSLMNLSMSFFEKSRITQFISRVNSDVEAIRQFLTDGILFIAGQVLMLLSILIVMLVMDWRLAIIAVLPAPFVFLFSKLMWPYIRNRWYSQWRSINQLNMTVGDSLQGIRVVKAFGQENQEKKRYDNASQVVKDETIRTDGMWQGIFPVFSFVTGIGALLVWYFGGQAVVSNQITLGTLMAFIAYLGMFFGPLQWFSQALNWMSRAFASADRIFEIMDTKLDVPIAKNPARLNTVEGQIDFQNVTFGYESHRPVLKKINLTVKPGEMIGLVGHSGAGKSTLINLLNRFYDPDEGNIYLDGINLKDTSQDDLHRHIGVVLQETFLFDGTVAENIAYANENGSPEEIMHAAKVANAHDFIIEMPDGYDTRVGERGQLLSGGQKQRIAIARAIFHQSKILILDEATASVDTDTEKKIQEALTRLMKGRTTFAIAHRLSTLRNADRLVVIDQGEIAEIGTHNQLLEKKGIYYKLVEAQKELSQIKGVGTG
ncbi:ABC transporter ATP-binding protein [Alkalihalobacillus trypoxylicola]|uniref:ABC transporter n=1 Tax=Alkalihalobacillus trypoxylicola TaxID=519424 RepID=A0A161P8F8_9BACI|nr:ABC transporter ATP-binding protein [Alkalihalobacillus trypoxylicola]KYG26978.1 ABC transporter [Alkalihalobacillus trypoxylicola]